MLSNGYLEVLHRLCGDFERGWRDREDAFASLAIQLGASRSAIWQRIYHMEKAKLVWHNGKRGSRPTIIMATQKGFAAYLESEENGWMSRKVDPAEHPRTPHADDPKTETPPANGAAISGIKEPNTQTKQTEEQPGADGIPSSQNLQPGSLKVNSKTDNAPVSPQTDPHMDEPEDDDDTPPDDDPSYSNSITLTKEARVRKFIGLLKEHEQLLATPGQDALQWAAEKLGISKIELYAALIPEIRKSQIMHNGDMRMKLIATAYWLPTATISGKIPKPIKLGQPAKKPKQKTSIGNEAEEPKLSGSASKKTSKGAESPHDLSPEGRVLWSLWIGGTGTKINELAAMTNRLKNAPQLSENEIRTALGELSQRGLAELHFAMPSGNDQWKPIR